MNHSTTPITLGETRRRISYDLRVVEFISPAQNLVIVEHPADGRRFVHTYDEVASWPIVEAPEPCDCVGTGRVTRVAHGYLGDAPRGTVQVLCAECGDDRTWCPKAGA